MKDVGLWVAPELCNQEYVEYKHSKKFYEHQVKPTLLPSMQSFFENTYEKARLELRKHGEVRLKDAWMLDLFKEIKRLPLEYKRVALDASSCAGLLKSYSKEVALKVAEFILAIEEGANHNGCAPHMSPLMFVGPPGTGKTYLATQLSSVTGLPIKYINLGDYSGFENRSLGEYTVQSSSEYQMYNGVLLDILLDSCGQSTNYINKIVLLDEVDKVLYKNKFGDIKNEHIYSWLHTLLDPTIRSRMPITRYNDTYYDFSKIHFILTGNQTFSECLSEKQGSSLESRVNLVSFKQGFTREKKKELVYEFLENKFPKAVFESLDASFIERLIFEDDAKGNEGIRVLLNEVTRYVNRAKNKDKICSFTGEVGYDDFFKSKNQVKTPKHKRSNSL